MQKERILTDESSRRQEEGRLTDESSRRQKERILTDESSGRQKEGRQWIFCCKYLCRVVMCMSKTNKFAKS
jgi:hypothetical protein